MKATFAQSYQGLFKNVKEEGVLEPSSSCILKISNLKLFGSLLRLLPSSLLISSASASDAAS